MPPKARRPGHRARRWPALCLLLLLAACGGDDTRLQEARFFAFGTLIDISLYDVDPDLGARAIQAAEVDFLRMHQAWHAWQPGPLQTVNQALAAGETLQPPAHLQALIREAQALSARSGGLFNPAIGGLVALWGFQQDDPGAQTPPDPAAIAALVARRPSMTDLVWEGPRLHSRNPALQLDFGAFAKGYGIDQVISHLREMGIQHAIVNAGGDLRAIGRHGERRWRIGIRDPRSTGLLASVEVDTDESVFTSGDYERYFDYQGRRYHHIIDPRSGYPAHGLSSVTVIHGDAATADAAATALFVAGARDWHATAQALGLRYVMVVLEDGRIQMNPAMAERLRLEQDPPPPVQLSAPL